MEIELRTRDASLPTFFQEFTERRLRFALDRYGTRIRRVRVWVADLNGPRGGRDKACRIKLEVIPSGVLVIEERAVDCYLAISRAVRRLAENLERKFSSAKRNRNGSEERFGIGE
jgi:putative sigma-54 modulation protein